MEFTTSAFTNIISFLAVCQALPPTFWHAPFAEIGPAPATTPPPPHAHDSRHDVCGASTLENRSSSASPRAEDCRQLARRIAGGGGMWTFGDLGSGVQQTLATYGTCAFGAEALDWFPYVVRGTSYFQHAKVGSQDVVDLVEDAVDRFEWEGLVGARGSCGVRAVSMGGGRCFGGSIIHLLGLDLRVGFILEV
ncbi:hypothetical protein PG997_010940 [Apiospora hydei]|uniref:Ecp2 effector protein-like domain-containing protein n=1 Tax=Apiospora hydei TaxID=1337664 RepID=A0ABR1VHW1_9PEZI